MAHDRRRRQPPLLNALAVAALALAACDKLDFHQVELPGFSFEAPTWMAVPKDAQYRAGQIEARKGTRMVVVTWQAGGIMTPEEMPGAIGVAIEQVARGEQISLGPARTVTVGGQQATQLDATSGSVKVTYVDIVCGKRSVMIGVIAVSKFETMRDRILGSFRCDPDPGRDAEIGDVVPIGSDDPATLAGWHFTDADREVFAITNDELVAVFGETAVVEDVGIDKLRTMMPAFLGAGGATFTPADGGRETRALADGSRRIFEFGDLTTDGERMSAVTTLWECDDHVRLVFGLVVLPDAARRGAAVDWLARLRCSRPGDKTSFEPEPEREPE